MKTNFLIFVIFLSFLSVPIFGQTKSDTVNKNNIKYKYALGIGAGFTTGYGLSCRFTPNKFGIQTTFSPYSNGNTTRYSIGLTLLYTLLEAEKTSFYLYQGNHFFYENNDNSYYNSKTKYFYNGVGFGIEVIILKHISLNLMGGYAFYENFDRLNLTGEVGLYYKF